ncbi:MULTISPECIES: winged helix-turn-helix domain-containing protein [unclassified Herbaspirillum]|uniref:winged helix-turn-helix domain-containing protein n=1 Tax=unclassified Herbaspirillum TaxID=2624150 RepID=UPI001150B9E2|nr:MULTISPECIES: LysR family transcriptional regulator [unclassified Herbaspirillum]MBB5392991.1 molybdate transport system regulatory protein [Herbaspirillum sp. SJZ102]TQK04364.1 molybdate transport system regulatory protein [Herbaspirillum sp. SJZ130]TQK09851.1 molybdate transport system regulatory protein [Herbaspirillum sp. SJZ106]
MTYSKTIRLRVMQGDTIAFGPGKADLLQAIERTGSISGAAREMDMSYRRAWLLVEEMNRCFSSTLVTTATGGARGGGAAVTGLGREVLARYQRMQKKAEASIAADLGYLHSLMNDHR